MQNSNYRISLAEGMISKLRNFGQFLHRKSFSEVRWLEKQMVSDKIDKDTYYNELTELVMKKVLTPVSTCIDVGCHLGTVLERMLKYSPNGSFFAFEPIPALYERLIQNFKKPNIHIYKLALSNTKGQESFNYVVTNPAYSGLIKRLYDRSDEVDEQIFVRTDLLDNILLSEKAGKVDLIKIDVEGAEHLVMMGAVKCISRDKPVIIFEFGERSSGCYGTGPEKVFDFLCNSCGLHISLLSDFLDEKPFLSLQAFSDQYYHSINYYFIAHA